MSMSSGVSVGPQVSNMVIGSKLLRCAGAHVLGQLVMKVDGAALAVRVGFGAWKTGRLHALLHRGHVREVLRQHGQPVWALLWCVLPFRLRLLTFGIELEHGNLEDAFVRVIARIR